jgi:hypothetical protein
MKPRGKILNKGAQKKIVLTHGAPTFVNFYTYVKLNKDTIVEFSHESMAYKVVKVE